MITGGVKFFTKNFSLLKNGASATASSNSSGALNILSFFPYTMWESVGSDDLTAEEILIDLGGVKTFDRIFLMDMNFKNFDVMYLVEEVYTHFANVITVNSTSMTNITETIYSRDSAYYEFTEVSAQHLRIRINTTQIADAEKYLTTLVATLELGTFEGFPKVTPMSDRNEIKTQTIGGKFSVQKTNPTFDISMKFSRYPVEDDLTVLETLFEREDPFLVWLCGGRTGSDYFKFNQRGWRLKDLINMQLVGNFSNEFDDGMYKLGFNKTLKFEEHI
jgi:hypothetical protein